MAKYKEQVASGETWIRANHITIENPLSNVPQIHFSEERAIALGPKEVVTKPVSSVAEKLSVDNLSETFPLINPETGEKIPDQFGTYEQLQVILHSLYLYIADKRDRGPQPHPSWTYNETTESWEAPEPKPYDTWEWDEPNLKWVAPVAKPETSREGYIWIWHEAGFKWEEVPAPPADGNNYEWDWTTNEWVLVT